MSKITMNAKHHPVLKLSQLQILLAIAEHKSFSEAALQLEMSQSAVSNAIATLEAELGIVLFSRGRHGAQLTPVGDRIAEHARKMVHIQDEILKEAQLARSLDSGDVRISSFRSVATHILPSIMAQFRQQFPHVAVHIQEYFENGYIEDDLRKGQADLGFVDWQTSQAEFDTQDVLEDEYVALFPPTFQPSNSGLRWEDLTQYPLIMVAEDASCDIEVVRHCAAFGVALQATYQVKADSTIVNMVAQGLGATIIPRLAAEPIPANVKVYSLPVPLFRTIRMAVAKDALLTPPVYAFLDLAKRSARDISTLNPVLS